MFFKWPLYKSHLFFPADELPYIAAASDDEIWKQDLESIELMEPIVSYIGDVKGKKPEKNIYRP